MNKLSFYVLNVSFVGNVGETPRRNSNGLTMREQKKQDLIDKVRLLQSKGLKQIDIAKELELSRGRVSQIFKGL